MSVWGIIPAAGNGTRIQPLAFSKELLPMGGEDRPKAVSEYLVERMEAGGATKLAFVISPGKSDIVEYYGKRPRPSAAIAYVVQPVATGLCDAIFRAAPLVHESEDVIVGLPDTIWFPEDALARLPTDRLAFLLFPVTDPSKFDAVLTDAHGRVQQIRVKHPAPGTPWIWGAFRMPGRIFHELHAFWQARPARDEYVGTLVNAWLAQGGEAVGVEAGASYVDVGTLQGYRAAMRSLEPAAVVAE